MQLIQVFDGPDGGSGADLMATDAAQPSPVRYASFWRRFVAWTFIDLPVLVVVGVAVGSNMGIFLGTTLGVLGVPSTTVEGIASAGAGIVGTILSWLYCAVMESSGHQGTLGKVALGLAVTREDGSRVTFLRASGRYVGKVLSSFFLGLGFFMIFSNEGVVP